MFGALRGAHPGRAIASLVGVIVVTAVLCVAVLSLLTLDADVARTLVVIGGASVLLAFLLGPVLTGATDQLDPRRFVVFGVDERRMPWILAAMSLVSIPSLALLAVGSCVAVVALRFGAPLALTLAAGVVGLLTTVLAARIGMALSARLLPERRSRELTALFVLVVLVVAFPVAVFLASARWNDEVPSALDVPITALGMTPFAATFGFTFAVGAGDMVAAAISAAVAVATLVALWLVWRSLVRRLLTTTERPFAARERTGLGWFAVLPANAFGAIAARSLVYWLRDRRHIMNVLVVPVAGIVTALPLMVAGVPVHVAALIPVLVMALFFGWLPHNDVAYDSTAFWTHVASGSRGLSDRLGRLIPVLLIAIPVLAIALPITMIIIDDWTMFAATIGLTTCLFLSALGLSSMASVMAPYAVARPGDSPFQQPQRSRSNAAVGPTGVFLGALLLASPTIWLFSVSVMTDAFSRLTLFVGLGTGLVVIIVGVILGGRFYDRHGEQLMEFVETS